MDTALALEICNNALLMIGGEEFQDFSEDTQQAKLCNALYERRARSLMELYPWYFSMKQTNLSYISGTPLDEYTRIYQMPPDRLRPLWRPLTTKDFRLFGDKIYAKTDEFKMEYQYRAPESVWTESFRASLEYLMAHVLSIALLDSADNAAEWKEMFTKSLRIAKQVDGQSRPPDMPTADVFLLTAVRG